jgi:formyl-CoA transferase
VGCEALRDDPRFATAPKRVDNRAELIPQIAEIVRKQSRIHWLRTLQAAGVPCGDIRSVGEVCEAEQLTNRGMILETEHPTAGLVRSIASPARFDGRPPPAPSPPPLLGEHTAEILREWLGEDSPASTTGSRASP